MEYIKFIKGKLLLICLAVFAIAIVAITVFKVPIGNLFFYAIFLACPLMHVFMMKGHGDHKKKGDTKGNGKSCH